MDLTGAQRQWTQDGFVVLPGYLGAEDVAAAQGELGLLFPSAEGFHGLGDERRNRFVGDEFAGIDSFPFASTELSLLAVHERLVDLAATLLGDDDLRLYSAEAWAKYTGAADYDQDLHRDYLNHTLVVPTDAPAFQQVEFFVYLVDVVEDLGPPHLVSRAHTADLPAAPNFYPRGNVREGDRFVCLGGRPDLYDAEVSAAGPAGSVVAFTPGTLHRGTQLRAPGRVRFSMQLCYRPAAVEWGLRQGWAARSHEPGWYGFVERATPRQLALFGFPAPGHPYWTHETLTGVQQRYPRLDLSPWRSALASGR